MRIKRPSVGTVLGALALFVALGGTALAAGSTIVNIADPTTPSHVAHVDANGRLEVGDGSGPLTVDGTTQVAAPSTFIHSDALNLNVGSGCVTVATAPAGKALVIREVRLDTTGNAAENDEFQVFGDTTCSHQVAGVHPASVGLTVIPFDPGLGIPAKSGVSVRIVGSLEADAYADGFSVAALQVPGS
jgi:hypothetical protein